MVQQVNTQNIAKQGDYCLLIFLFRHKTLNLFVEFSNLVNKCKVLYNVKLNEICQ